MTIVQCPNCGNNISDQTTRCPYCGCVVRVGRQAENVPQDMRKVFNWGAAGLWPVWGFSNGLWWLSLVFFSIILLGSDFRYFAFAAVSIYMGVKGGELAWSNGSWRDVNHFVVVQKMWTVWGIVFFAVSMLYCLALSIICRFF
jgi:hypothetical protein